MTFEFMDLLRAAHVDMFKRYPAESLLGLQFPVKVSFKAAGREIRHYLKEAERISSMKILPFGIIIQGVERTHVHLLLIGFDKKTGRTLKNLSKDVLDRMKAAWKPTIKGKEIKRLDRYLEPIVSTEATSVYLSEPHNLKLSSDISRPDQYQLFGDFNDRLVTRAVEPKIEKERAELKLAPLLELPFSHLPCFSFLFTPVNKCCFKCGLSDKCMKSTRERLWKSSAGSCGTVPPVLFGEYGLPVSEDPKPSISVEMLFRIPEGPALQAEIHKYRSQPITPPDRISEAAWKEKIAQAEVNKHPRYFLMNVHERNDEHCRVYNRLLRKYAGLGWKSGLLRVTLNPYHAMKTPHWIHLCRARVWADFFGSTYEEFLEPIFAYYNEDHVKKSLFPAPHKLYGKTALSAYMDFYTERTYPHLGFHFSMKDPRFADYLAPDLLPENYTGTPRQVAFYERIHADFRRMAAETRREITKVIDDEIEWESPVLRELMYAREGKEVPPKKPPWFERLPARKPAESPEPVKPPDPIESPEELVEQIKAALKSEIRD